MSLKNLGTQNPWASYFKKKNTTIFMSFLGTPRKINIEPGKWCWKMSLLLGRPIFRFHVKLREGIQAILLNTQPDIKKTNLRSPKPHKLSRLSDKHTQTVIQNVTFFIPKHWRYLFIINNIYVYTYITHGKCQQKHPAELRYKSFTETEIMSHKKGS